MSEFAVFSRKKVTINTDPQRRCYDGCNFSEKTVWSEWKHIVDLRSMEEAEEWVRSSRLINPKRQYKWRNVNEPDCLDGRLSTTPLERTVSG